MSPLAPKLSTRPAELRLSPLRAAARVELRLGPSTVRLALGPLLARAKVRMWPAVPIPAEPIPVDPPVHPPFIASSGILRASSTYLASGA